VVEHLTSLADKSLVVNDPDYFVPEFRLLETVRADATEKFLATGELDELMQRLARPRGGAPAASTLLRAARRFQPGTIPLLIAAN
jgi:predicted ATPase